MSTALLNRRLTQAVTLHIRGPGAEDEHGNAAPVETDLETSGFLTAQSPQEGSQAAVLGESFTLYLPAGSPVEGWDAVTVDGAKYEVIGTPWHAWNPRTSSEHHVIASLRRAGTS